GRRVVHSDPHGHGVRSRETPTVTKLRIAAGEGSGLADGFPRETESLASVPEQRRASWPSAIDEPADRIMVRRALWPGGAGESIRADGVVTERPRDEIGANGVPLPPVVRSTTARPVVRRPVEGFS